jgi:hypothetical protein
MPASKYAKLNEVEPDPTPGNEQVRIMHFAKHTKYAHTEYAKLM